MPHLWNNQLVVTKDELVPAWYKTVNALCVTVQRFKDREWGIKRASTGHNGSQMLILFDSLAPQIQQALGDPRKCTHILERFFKIDGDAVSFYASFRFEDGTYLATEYQERYIANASMIKAVIALRQDRETMRRNLGGKLKNVPATLCADAHSFQPTLLSKHKLQHTLPENERCFMDAIRAFERDGYPSLISKKHKNQNTRKVTDETLDLLNSLFAGDRAKPTATE